MFLKYCRNIAKNDPVNHQRNITLKDFMKYLCNNEVLFSVILKNYFSIFQELFLKYSNNTPTNDKAKHSRNVTKKLFMKYYYNISKMFLA